MVAINKEVVFRAVTGIAVGECQRLEEREEMDHEKVVEVKSR